MLKINQLNSGYGGTKILRDLNMEIPQGQVIALMGRNGMGKTTLLKSIMGIISPESGEILFASKEITSMPTDERVRLGIGYVPQGREIFPYLTVEENLLLGLEAKGVTEYRIPEGIYELFPALRRMLSRKGGDLSGGQQQQLAIARVLAAEPKLLVLDEPTEGIQPSIVHEIENIIRFIKEQKTISVLLVEQYVDFALRLADKYYLLEKGSIVSSGRTAEINREIINNHLAV
ncbi:urea ABC transporter ATP-binding subunit UrtE [bacterium]|nr:urea ABC transporter ATP-binding subunit UrtE [bacterium]